MLVCYVEAGDAVLKSSEFMLMCYTCRSKRCSLEEFKIHANVLCGCKRCGIEFRIHAMLVCYVEIGDAVLSKSSKYIGVCYMEVMQS